MLLKQSLKRILWPPEPTAIMDYQRVYSLQLGGTCQRKMQDPRFPSCTLPKASLSLRRGGGAMWSPKQAMHVHLNIQVMPKANAIHQSPFFVVLPTSTLSTICSLVAWCPRCSDEEISSVLSITHQWSWCSPLPLHVHCPKQQHHSTITNNMKPKLSLSHVSYEEKYATIFKSDAC